MTHVQYLYRNVIQLYKAIMVITVTAHCYLSETCIHVFVIIKSQSQQVVVCKTIPGLSLFPGENSLLSIIPYAITSAVFQKVCNVPTGFSKCFWDGFDIDCHFNFFAVAS